MTSQTTRVLLATASVLLGLTYASPSLAGKLSIALPEASIESLPFAIADERPSVQSKTGQEAFSVGSCAYSSLRVGDNIFTPSRVAILAESLRRNHSERLAGSTVSVRNFVIHRNFGKQTREELKRIDGGALAKAIAGGMADSVPMSCPTDDLRGGYSPEEAPNGVAPIVVVIDVVVLDKPFHVRIVHEPMSIAGKEKANAFVARTLTEAIKLALESLNQQLSASVSSGA